MCRIPAWASEAVAAINKDARPIAITRFVIFILSDSPLEIAELTPTPDTSSDAGQADAMVRHLRRLSARNLYAVKA
jgi:hypothetical protein